MIAAERNQARGALKRKITRALGKRLDPASPLSNYKRADDRGRNGFVYTDEAGEYAFVPRDKDNSERIGVYVRYHAARVWGQGRYDEANKINRAETFRLAAVLTEAGFKVTWKDNPDLLVVWADENERV